MAASMTLFPLVGFALSAPAAETYELQAKHQAGDLSQVRIAVEVDGKLKINPDGKKVRELPLKVDGELLYDERWLEAGPAAPTKEDSTNTADQLPSRRTVRLYREAAAKINVDGHLSEPTVREDRRLLVCQSGSAELTLFSPSGPLTREELELVDVQAPSTLVSELLPSKPVAVKDEWHIPDRVLAALLRIDTIETNQVKATLREVKKEVAHIDLEGRTTGAIGGISTQIGMRATLRFDRVGKQVDWFALAIREQRAVGHASPGLDVTARLRMVIGKLPAAAELEESALDGLALDLRPGIDHLATISTQGHFRTEHDRRWFLAADHPQATILRMIDRGELVAQCNINGLPDLGQKEKLEMKEFRGQVEKALGKNFGEIVNVDETTTEAGLKVLRVVAVGMVAELPIQWIYCHLTDPDGRRASVVFTLETKLADRFAGADHEMLSRLAFLARPGSNPLEPTPEEKPAADKPVAAKPAGDKETAPSTGDAKLTQQSPADKTPASETNDAAPVLEAARPESPAPESSEESRLLRK